MNGHCTWWDMHCELKFLLPIGQLFTDLPVHPSVLPTECCLALLQHSVGKAEEWTCKAIDSFTMDSR